MWCVIVFGKAKYWPRLIYPQISYSDVQ
jgi:hypothetical protein